MKSYFNLLLVLILLTLLNPVGAQEFIRVNNSHFSISPEKNLEIFWKNKKLISGDAHSWIGNKNMGTADKFETDSAQGWQITNAWSKKKRLPFRREVGISPDGNKIEISFQSHQDALMKTYPDDTIAYKIIVPLSALGNATWEAFAGRPYNSKWSVGKINASTPDGNITGTSVRWISFATSQGDITFDFNPQGVTTYYMNEANAIHSQWSLFKKGENLEMVLAVPASQFGGALTGKFTIFEGGRGEYLNRHAVSYYHYFSELPAERLYCFGCKSTKEFTDASSMVFDEKSGFGWKTTDDLKIEGGILKGVLYSSVTSKKNNSFISKNLRSGLYLITIRSGSIDKNIGPFTVSHNGEEIFSDIKVEKGNVANLTCVRWIEKGEEEITFDGNWAVSVLGFQLFMHSEEDYEFRRGFWIKNDGYCPDVMFANYYSAPPVYGKSVTISPLAGEVIEIKNIPELHELTTALPNQYAEELSWRSTSPLGTMGPANFGSFNEFNTQKKINTRLKQVKDGGVEAVILNGLLSRHTFPEHLTRVEENIRETVKSGHKKGMKFIDHQDLTILWNMDMGFRFLAEHPGFLQISHSNGLPTWGICPNNTQFNKDYFFPYITEHIRNTGIDGLMVDECTFHGSNYCNCADCRAKFSRETNLILPDDETNPILRNSSSKLWKAWIEWRKNAIAQWRIDLSKLTHEINPDFSNIQYYSEGGFIHDYASYEQGGDLALSAKSMDFLGTEIMSRDLWDNYRYNFTSRNIYNSLRETYGSPVFGLVYPYGQINYAIIGWAMNNMLAQSTWSMESFNGSEKMDDYTGWKENMNNITAVPFTDVAVVFSRHARDWSLKNKNTYPNEIMGLSQLLTENHIQHTFILDDALLNQDISRFRVLLAPGMDCLSDEQVAKLREFVENGGTLYITGDAGKLTSYGEPRENFAFAGLFKKNQLEESDYTESGFGKGRIIYSPERYGLNDFCKFYTIENTYMFNPDTNITITHKKLLQKVLGPQSSFKAIAIPEKVIVSVYNEMRNEKKLTLVHLLNATGVEVKNGDLLPLNNPTWNEIQTEMSFEILLPAISELYYTSPDSPGHKTITSEKTGEGKYKITIPAGTVERYGIVYLYE